MHEANAGASREKAHLEVVRRLNSLVNSDDFDGMDALFQPDFVDHNPNIPLGNLAGLKEVIRSSRQGFGIQNTIEAEFASEDLVAVRVVSRGYHRVPAFGQAPTGREAVCLNHEIYRLVDGRIAERWVVSDIYGLMRQLGVALPG